MKTKTVFDLYKNGRLVAVCSATTLAAWFPMGVTERSVSGTYWGLQSNPWYVIRRFVDSP